MRSIQSDEKKTDFATREAHVYVILYPSAYDWPFRIGCWNAYVACLMGVAYKNVFFVKSDIFSDAPEQI